MKGNRRVTGLEQCYTPRTTADTVIDLVADHINDWQTRTWIEPAAGLGTFIDALNARHITNIHTCDIDPADPRIPQADFLNTNFPVRDAITISNPPFGRNNSLSIPFFNHAAQFSNHICFIVPRSWRKWSVINRLDPAFHLIADHDLQINYLGRDSQPISTRNHLQTAIQLWERQSNKRPKVDIPDRGYIRKTSPQDADVALTVFGRNCGTVRTNFERVPNTTQMYLAVNDPTVLTALTVIDYSRFYNNVAYIEALSIKEIWFLLNEHFDNLSKENGT